MKKFSLICLFLCTSIISLVLFVWATPHEIRHYTVDDLVGSTCKELGEQHEEVIFAYHDAEIAHYRRTGAFHDDVGVPKDDALPFDILVGHFIQVNDLRQINLSEDSSAATRKLHSNFSSEISNICATSPMLQAVDAMRQAATKLNLAGEPKD